MATRAIRTQTPGEVRLQEVIAELQQKFASERVWTYCYGEHKMAASNSKPLYEDIIYSDKMKDLVEGTFKLIEQAAQSGKTGLDFEGDFDQIPSKGIFSAVLSVFQEKFSLEGFTTGLSPDKHSPLCGNNPSLTLTWKSDNPYFNTKPMFRLPETKACGGRGLNEDRLAGKGDCTLDFGGQKFKAHQLIVGKFSPVIEAMLQGKMKESESKVVSFPAITDLSKETLEALMGFMYIEKIDYSKMSPLEAIRLLELSDFFQSDALKKSAYEHLGEVGDKLKSPEILRLCFLQMEHSFEELLQLCTWLMRVRPDFFADILQQEEIPSEDLVMLFGVARHFQMNVLREQLEVVWNEMTTAEKTGFVRAALTKGSVRLLEEIEGNCNNVVEDLAQGDPERDNFVEAYGQLRQGIFELKTRRSPLEKK